MTAANIHVERACNLGPHVATTQQGKATSELHKVNDAIVVRIKCLEHLSQKVVNSSVTELRGQQLSMHEHNSGGSANQECRPANTTNDTFRKQVSKDSRDRVPRSSAASAKYSNTSGTDRVPSVVRRRICGLCKECESVCTPRFA